MNGWVLLLFTVLLTTFITDTIAQSFAADYNGRSCSPCGLQYIVNARSELLGDIARHGWYPVMGPHISALCDESLYVDLSQDGDGHLSLVFITNREILVSSAVEYAGIDMNLTLEIPSTIKSVVEYCNTKEKDLRKENPDLTNENITSFQAINIS
ncbi:hypothetical protein SUGI_0468920 [Cryptomeria japonica]|nr:hypothetical protein SUGI_0468920 [Cryptomeria japonica]